MFRDDTPVLDNKQAKNKDYIICNASNNGIHTYYIIFTLVKMRYIQVYYITGNVS